MLMTMNHRAQEAVEARCKLEAAEAGRRQQNGLTLSKLEKSMSKTNNVTVDGEENPNPSSSGEQQPIGEEPKVEPVVVEESTPAPIPVPVEEVTAEVAATTI